MSRIPMPPPGGILATRKHADVLVYGQPLYIDFAVDGYFGPVEHGIFTPEFPSGPVSAGPKGPFTAVRNDTEVNLVFVPTSTGEAHLETVQVRTPLP